MKYLILNIIAVISIIVVGIFWITVLLILFFGGEINGYKIKGILDIIRKWF